MRCSLASVAWVLIGCFALNSDARAWDPATEGQLVVRRQESADSGLSGAIWTFTRTPNGDFFVGGDGVVLSRGFRQQKMPVPTSYGFKALAADDRGRVWLGAVDEVGFLEMDATGDYTYTSLLAPFHADVGPALGSVQAAQVLGSTPVFVSENAVYGWTGSHFSHWSLPSATRLQPLRPTPQQLCVYQRGVGIRALTPTGPKLRIPQASLPADPIWLLAPAVSALSGESMEVAINDGWLLGTGDRVFVRSSDLWQEIPAFAAHIGNANATSAIRLDSSTLAIGTQNLGVLIFTDKGKLIGRVDRDTALSDNQAIALWSDQPGDLWIGTANGWVRVTSPDRISTFPAGSARRNDAVRSQITLPQAVFAATALGVQQIVPAMEPGEAAKLVPLPSTPGPVWTLSEIQGELFAGGVGGLWRWDGKSWSSVHSTAGDVLMSHASRRHPGRLYFTDGPNLYSLERRKGAWVSFSLQQNAGDTPSSLLEDAQGDVWVSTVLEGVRRYRVTKLPEGIPAITEIAHYRPGVELPANRKRPKLFLSGSRLVLFDETDVLAFDEKKQAFESLVLFEGLKGIGVSGEIGNGAAYWLMERREPQSFQQIFSLAEVSTDGDGKWQAVPLSAESLNSVGQPSLVSVQPSPSGPVIWLGATRGLARLPRASMTLAPPPPPVQLASVVASERTLPGQPQPTPRTRRRLPLKGDIDLPTLTQYVIFEFLSTPAPGNGAELTFQSQLAGLQQEWTPAQSFGFRDFTGLAPGDYEFRARAVDRFGRPGPAASYRFRRLAPWYARWPMWFAYGGVLIIGVVLSVRLRLRQLNRQNERLNRMVDERTRELAMANSAKMDFLTSISHEIRNPLNGVVGLVNLLKESAIGPREQELTASLAACARSLRRVFDEVLGFARLEEGRVQVRESPFRLQSLLEDTVKVFSAEAAQRGCELRLVTDPALPPLRGDHEKIRTIVGNFLGNALKYAPGAPIEIETQAEFGADGRVDLTLQVRDHGPGIPMNEQELIFRKFVRGTGVAEQREPGAGLGLATCQALAQLIGGSVGVESPSTPLGTGPATSFAESISTPSGTSPLLTPRAGESGRGSTFFLRLNLARASEPLVEVEPEIPGPSVITPGESMRPGSRTPLRALVVEDQSYNQQVAHSILRRLNYVVDIAPDATSCRRLAETHAYALILLDWDVPGAKGSELARWLRARPGGHVPVVLAVTAHDSEDIRQLCLDAGMNSFLVKPLDEATLASAVAAARARQFPSNGPRSNVNFQIFDYLGQNDPVRTRRAASDYLEQLEIELAELRRAFADGTTATISSVAHRLRAHAAIVRCGDLMDASRQLQEAAAIGAVSHTLFERVEESAENLRTELETFMPAVLS